MSKLGIGLDESSSPIEGKSSTGLKLGLFSYPVLQAADILVHRATEVPVGEDQTQHLELTREVAATFHHGYGPVFPLPKTLLSPAKRIMSLRTPNQKMSKSDPDIQSRILLTDSADAIALKLKRAVTDSHAGVSYDPKNRPGVANLVRILTHIQCRGNEWEEDFVAVAAEHVDCDKKTFKEQVTASVVEQLRPIREEYNRVMAEGDGYLESIVEEGARDARIGAEETMQVVRKAVGLR